MDEMIDDATLSAREFELTAAPCSEWGRYASVGVGTLRVIGDQLRRRAIAERIERRYFDRTQGEKIEPCATSTLPPRQLTNPSGEPST